MSRTKRLVADLTSIALPLEIMDRDGARSDLASSRTPLVRENWFDVSIGSELVCIGYSMPMDSYFFKSS